jgi:hypothetical protein
VEYVVDFSVVRELESVGDIGYFCQYFEWSVSPWCQLHCSVWEFQMGALKPNFVVFFERLILCFFCHSVLGCLQGF